MNVFKNELEKNNLNLFFNKFINIKTFTVKEILKYNIYSLIENNSDVYLIGLKKILKKAHYFIEKNKNEITVIETQLCGYEDCDIMNSEFALLIILTTLLNKHKNVTEEILYNLIDNEMFNAFLTITTGYFFKSKLEKNKIFLWLQSFKDINEPDTNCQICETTTSCRITKCYKRICATCYFTIKNQNNLYKCPFCKSCETLYCEFIKYCIIDSIWEKNNNNNVKMFNKNNYIFAQLLNLRVPLREPLDLLDFIYIPDLYIEIFTKRICLRIQSYEVLFLVAKDIQNTLSYINIVPDDTVLEGMSWILLFNYIKCKINYIAEICEWN
jgi:hypothetical protein